MAETIHRRYIQIDEDTIVGYNYIKKKFYITNKETTTYRNTAEQTVVVLNVLGVKTPEGTKYTAKKLKEEIYDYPETLEKIYCTLEDTGSYIRTLQFNDWVGYPLEIDCEKKNIFIRNTDILYSLELNESPKSRVARFCSFYSETLGMDIPNKTMFNVYQLLVQQYNEPYFYNVLSNQSVEDAFSYTGNFQMTNFANLSDITCEGAKNPNNKFNNDYLINLESVDTANYQVNFQKGNYINPDDVKILVGDKILIQGATQEIEGTEYTTDGEYTISKLINSSLGDKNWCGLTYKDNVNSTDKFVALSADGYITQSEDGNTWSTPLEIPELRGQEWIAIAYGNDKLMVLSKFGYTNTCDGTGKWGESSPIEALQGQEWTALMYNPGSREFIALSYYGFFSVYDEGESAWTAPKLMWGKIERNSKGEITGPSTYLQMSDDQKQGWTSIIPYSQDKLMAMNNLGYYCTATNNSPPIFGFPKVISNKSDSWSCLTCKDSNVMAISSDGYFTTGYPLDGVDDFRWDTYQDDNLGRNNWSSLIYNDSKLYALSLSGYLSVNEDGKWSEADTKSDNNIVGVQVEEPLYFDYQYPYPTCYAQSALCPLISMERNANVIRVLKSDFSENVIVGDIIHVTGTEQEISQEIVSCDGAYTITDISTQVRQISNSVISMGSVTEEINNESVTRNQITISTKSTELKEGNVVEVTGTNSTNDKKYTIKTIVPGEESTVLEVEESIPYLYGYSYSTDKLVEVSFSHTEVTNTMELPASFNVIINQGDLIQVRLSEDDSSTTYTVLKVIHYASGERLLSLDGAVTTASQQSVYLSITSMNNVTVTYTEDLYYNIYVEENVPTDFISSSEHQGKFYKEVFVGNIVKISSFIDSQSRIYLDSIADNIKLENESTLYIYIQEQKYTSQVSSAETAKYNQILIKKPKDSFTPYISQMPVRASVSLLTPKGDILLNITSEHEALEDIVPLGNFMLDNFEQCQEYIKTLKDLDNKTIKEKSYIPTLGEDINKKMYTILNKGDIFEYPNIDVDIVFKGLYSTEYTN